MCFRRATTALLVIAGPAVLYLAGQESAPPTVENVRALQAKFKAERDFIVKKRIAKRFLPAFMARAEEIARRADKALEANRWLQAAEGFHQARWQLPYQSPQVPAEHVARVLGNLRLRHAQEIHALAFSPDGTRVATGSRDRTVKIWDLGNGHEVLSFTGHDDVVRAVAFSPDGKTVASAGGDKDVRLWASHDGKEVQVLKGEGTYVTSLAYSPDGKYLVAGFDDKALRIYETATGNVKRTVADFRSTVRHVSFNRDGKILAAGDDDGVVRLWEFSKMIENPTHPAYWEQHDPSGATYQVVIGPDNKTFARCGADGIKIYNLALPGSALQAAAPKRIIAPADAATRFLSVLFSKDSKTLFTGGVDGLIRLWDVETGQSVGTFKGHNAEVNALAFNAAGSTLASASTDHTVRLWHFDVTVQSRDFAGHTGAVWSAVFSPDSRQIVSAGADRTAKIWDFTSGKVLHELTGHKSGVTAVAFASDGTRVITGSGDNTLKIWDATTASLIRTLEGHTGTVTAIDIARDGLKIVSGGADKRIKVWDAQGKELLDISATSVVTAVVFSSDGKRIASGHIDHAVRLWDAATGKMERSWTAHAGAVSGLAFHPEGTALATCGADSLVRVWPLATPGTNPITLTGHNSAVSSVAFHKNGRHLASCGGDRVVKLWKLEGNNGKEEQNYRGHRDWVSSVSFSRDGHYLVSASVDRAIKVWEITSREIPLEAEHTGAVEAVAVSPDGTIVASGAMDRTIKLWNRQTGAEIRTLHGHTAEVVSLAFTPNGKTLLSGSVDRTLKLWDVSTGKELPKLPKQENLTFVNPLPLVMVSPDGQRILAWVPGNERQTTISVFDFQGNEVFSFHDTDRNVVAGSFQSNGRHVALASKEGVIRIFDLEKNGQLLPGGDWPIFDKDTGMGDLALTPDGKTLLAGSGSGELRILDVAKRTVLHGIKAHPRRVGVVMVSPDGKRFATVGFENVLKLWDLQTAKELRRWDMNTPDREHTPFVMTVAFTPDGRQLVTANANSSLYILDLP